MHDDLRRSRGSGSPAAHLLLCGPVPVHGRGLGTPVVRAKVDHPRSKAALKEIWSLAHLLYLSIAVAVPVMGSRLFSKIFSFEGFHWPTTDATLAVGLF